MIPLLERESKKIRLAVFAQRRTQAWTAVDMQLEVAKASPAFLPGIVLYLIGQLSWANVALLIGGLIFATWATFVCWHSFKAMVDLKERAYDKVLKFQLPREYWDDNHG